MTSGERIRFGTKFWYGVGDVGNNLFIVTTGMYLLYFLTNIAGVEPALAGLALLIPKLWDVVSDPLMGIISDRTHSRLGRRRPYLLGAALPFGGALLALFWLPGYDSEVAKVFHVGGMFAVACTAFTVFNVPYSAMVAEMTDDYNERTALTSFRMMSASVGALVAGGAAMPLVQAGGNGHGGYRLMAAVFGASTTLFCLACFVGTRNARVRVSEQRGTSIAEQLRVAARNTPFVMLMLTYLLQSLGIGVLMAGLIYYVKYAMRLPESAMGIVFPIFLVTALVFMPMWVMVGRKLGKIRAYRVGLVVMLVMLLTLYATPAGKVTLFHVQVFLLGIGFSAFQLFPFSMLPDTVEFDQQQSGMRREGIFSGFWSAGQKTAYSVGPTLVGFALSLGGFVKEGQLAQPASVEAAIRIIFCLFPALALLLSFIPFARYDLTQERFDEIKAKLAE